MEFLLILQWDLEINNMNVKIIPFAVIVILICCNQVDNYQNNTKSITVEKTNYLTFENDEFSIVFPNHWDTSYTNEVFYANESYLDSSDNFKECFNVIKYVEAKNVLLKEIVNKNINQIRNDFGLKVNSIESVNKNNLRYLALKYKLRVGKIWLINYQSFFKKEDKVFIITQTLEYKNVKEYEKKFLTIIDNFKFL